MQSKGGMGPGTIPGSSFQKDQKTRVSDELTVIPVERIEPLKFQPVNLPVRCPKFRR